MEQQKMGMSKRQFRIGDLAKELKVKKFVIRFWEKEFNLKSDRSNGGQRFYTKKDFDTFMLIKDLLYSQGFTISGAKKQLDAVSKGDVIPAQKYVAEEPKKEEPKEKEPQNIPAEDYEDAQEEENDEDEDEELEDIEDVEELERVIAKLETQAHVETQAQEEIIPASSQDLIASSDFTPGACCLHAQPEVINSNTVIYT